MGALTNALTVTGEYTWHFLHGRLVETRLVEREVLFLSGNIIL